MEKNGLICRSTCSAAVGMLSGLLKPGSFLGIQLWQKLAESLYESFSWKKMPSCFRTAKQRISAIDAYSIK